MEYVYETKQGVVNELERSDSVMYELTEVKVHRERSDFCIQDNQHMIHASAT